MQVKKHTIQVSVILMVLSLIVLTILQFQLYPKLLSAFIEKMIHENARGLRDYLIMISGGIFTSTFVTVSIAIREYKDARTEALIEYYYASSDFLKKFRNLQYLHLDYPVEIVKSCFWEEAENKRKNIANIQIEQIIKKSSEKKKVIKRVYEKLSFEEKEKMKTYIWNNTDTETKHKLDNAKLKNQYLEEKYKRIMQDYYCKIDDVMKQYIEIKKCSYDIVESSFGKIDFIFSNKRLRQNFIYKKLHERQRSIFQKIVKEAWHFEQYYEMENGNLPVILDKIMIIQDYLFEKQEGEIGYTIYNSYCYEIDKQLSELLGITYGKGYEQFVPDFRNYRIFFKIDAKKYKDANERINKENSERK